VAVSASCIAYGHKASEVHFELFHLCFSWSGCGYSVSVQLKVRVEHRETDRALEHLFPELVQSCEKLLSLD
jgi:hypothetical protein